MVTPIERQSVTPAEKAAYVRKLLQIERRFGRLESDTLKRSIALLRDFRNRVAGEMSQLSDFEQWRIRELQANLEALIAQYEGQLQSMSAKAIRTAVNLGRAAVVEPLEAAGFSTLFFRPSPAQINVLLDFSADLIRGITGDMGRKINTQIRISALGEKSSFQAMKDITKILNLPTKDSEVVKGVAYEAERILRTETNRAYNLATFSQQRDLAEQVPGLQKMWMATGDNRTRTSHLEAHGQIQLVNEPFIVGKNDSKLMYPLDPAGPPEETIMCRCRPVTIIPEIGKIPGPLDAKIKAERARRAELEKEKAAKKARADLLAKAKAAEQEWLVKQWYQKEGPQGQTVFGIRNFSRDQAGKAKSDIVTAISEQTGIEYSKVNRVIGRWAETSNDNDPSALHIQHMASEVFDVPLSEWQMGKMVTALERPYGIDPGGRPETMESFKLLPDDDMKRLLQNMYDNTQEELRGAGITSVRLYRGTNSASGYRDPEINVGDTLTLEANAIESWSLLPTIAGGFGNIGVFADVPVEDIIGTARTGFGCLNEWEFIVRGGLRGVLVWQSR